MSKSPKKFSKSDLAEHVPSHVAIIMDGNGRWARKRMLNRILGHERGIEVVRNVATHCSNRGVRHLTLYAFSEENWQRPASEISALMHMLKKFLVVDRPLFVENRIRLESIGRIKKLPSDVLNVLHETQALTASHTGMQLTLALSYGGRTEIVDAVRQLAEDILSGTRTPQDLQESDIRDYLYQPDTPDPDLMIRTSGEQRTSNFLTWQSAYTELYFTPTLWPDFTVEELEQAFIDYSRRERRFGKTSEQLAGVGT